MRTLHLTNGDHAADALGQSGLTGDILPWRDILHDGPVPDDRDSDAFRRVRADFLSGRGWSSSDSVLRSLIDRDQRLDEVADGDELVLWFEPDLYDQLQLMQVLARLARRAEPLPRVSIAPADCLLGPLAPENFPALYESRRDLDADDVATGAEAWQAFTADTPDTLLAVTTRLDGQRSARTYADDPAVRLPYLTSALRRVLEEFPDTQAGLSRTERQVCEILANGPRTLRTVFQAQQKAESWVWLGDSSFAWYVQRLSDCANPLVLHANGSRVVTSSRSTGGKSFWDRPVELTALGHDVVRDRADQVQLNGIDRWIGGVHCQTTRHWRWDPHHHHLAPRRV